MGERACKPGSVVDDHLSRLAVTDKLKQATRMRVGPTHSIPIRPCFGWGLPSRAVTDALVRSYRTVSAFLLFGAGEFSFLWHFPSGHPVQPLAGILPCEARTFLTDKLSAIAQPAPN